MTDRALSSRRLRPALVVLATLATMAMAAAAATPDATKIVNALRIPAGSAVAVTGAGAGDMIAPLTRAVGAKGHVFILEADQAVAQSLRHQVELSRQANASVILAAPGDVQLPHTVDVLVLYNAYRSIEKREAYFASIRKYLRARARVVVVDYYKRPMKVGPPQAERVASSQVMAEMHQFGFDLARRYNILADRYVLAWQLKRP